MPARMLSLLVAGAIALAACSGGGGGSDDEASSSTGPTTAASTECLPRSSIIPREGADAEAGALLTATNLEQIDACADRMTFTFESLGVNAPPGYLIAYVEALPTPGRFVDDDPTETTTPTTNEDGTPADPETVDVAGDAWLVITFRNSSGFDVREEEPTEVYTGQPEWIPGTGSTNHVAEAQVINDIDGELVWIIGVMGGQRPFTVDSTIDTTAEVPTSTVTIEIG